MSRLLHIVASPRGFSSASWRVGNALVGAYRKANPTHGSETLNVFTDRIPEFNEPQAAAKYRVMSGQEPQDDQAAAWKPVIDAINHFKSFDKYVISAGMWNFGIPWRLKQYFDVIVQPGLTFSYSPQEGYKGLVTGRPVALVLARGGQYGQGNPAETYDFQRSYLETVLGFIGFTDIRTIPVEPMLSPDAEKVIAAATEQAIALAGTL